MDDPSVRNEIQLISDGDGLAVIGDPAAVERFMVAEGLMSKEFRLPNLNQIVGSVVSIADSVSSIAGSMSSIAESTTSIAETVGKWVKVSQDVAKVVEKYHLSVTKNPGLLQAVVSQVEGLKGFAQVSQATVKVAGNPAVLSGPAGVMSQMAMQQAMAEILEYLKAIDRKLDDVLRNQKNDVLARMDGVRLAIDEAMTIRDSVGRVSEITWSKVQNTSGIILETQSYALRQLEDLAIKIEESKTVADLTKAADEINEKLRLWTRVLADCFRLHDAIAVLELDRVLDSSPEELDRHRMGLKAARQERLSVMSRATSLLLVRMNDATGTANSKVLFNPFQTKELVKTTNEVASDVQEFHVLLGIESGWTDSEARAWTEAANESWEKTCETGSEGIRVAKQFSKETRSQAKSARDKLAGKISERLSHKDNESEK